MNRAAPGNKNDEQRESELTSPIQTLKDCRRPMTPNATIAVSGASPYIAAKWTQEQIQNYFFGFDGASLVPIT